MEGFEQEVMNEAATIVEAVVEPVSKTKGLVGKIVAGAIGIGAIVLGGIFIRKKRRSKNVVAMAKAEEPTDKENSEE